MEHNVKDEFEKSQGGEKIMKVVAWLFNETKSTKQGIFYFLAKLPTEFFVKLTTTRKLFWKRMREAKIVFDMQHHFSNKKL